MTNKPKPKSKRIVGLMINANDKNHAALERIAKVAEDTGLSKAAAFVQLIMSCPPVTIQERIVDQDGVR